MKWGRVIPLLLALSAQRAFACEHDAEASSPRQDVNRLQNPELVHSRARTTVRDDEAIIQALEHRIKCTCGCGLDVFVCRTTDFSCTTSPAMHRLVLARLDSGLTADQVVAKFEEQYGQSILMQPPKRGFNWAAYVVPFVALGAGLVLLVWVMRRWTKARVTEVTEVTDVTGVTEGRRDEPALERLQRELEKFEA